MVLDPAKEDEARGIFEKWGLDFAIVGITTDDLRFRVVRNGVEVADLPIKELGDEAPEYDRPWVAPTPKAPLEAGTIPDIDIADTLMTLIGTPDLASRRWVWEQYDHLIQGNTIVRPGSDAAIVRVTGHDKKALAFSSDVTPRYCEADPFEGGKQAVAECWRNLTASGATPLAASDNLNFGNPEKPEIMGQLVRAIQGIGEACRALNFPIVSGNVSLYNETKDEPILPTPTIAGVGLITDIANTARMAFAAEGEIIVLVGAPDSWGTHLGQSIFLREICDREDGPPPPVDLEQELRTGNLVRSLIQEHLVTAVHDCSDGGLAIALTEMAIASDLGATISAPNSASMAATFFGEDQGRYVMTLRLEDRDALWDRCEKSGVGIAEIGKTTTSELKLGDAKPISVEDLRTRHEAWFPQFMKS